MLQKEETHFREDNPRAPFAFSVLQFGGNNEVKVSSIK